MNISYAQEQQDIYSQIEQLEREVERLESELASIDAEMEEIRDDREKNELLSGIADRLDKLGDNSAEQEFWMGVLEGEALDTHMNRLREKVSYFERRVNNLAARRERIISDIEGRKTDVEYLLDDIEVLEEEESLNEFVIERDVIQFPCRPLALPWARSGKEEREYRRLMLLFVLYSILIGLLIPMWKLPLLERVDVVEIPERLATLVQKHIPEPVRKPEPKKVEEPRKPEETTRKAEKKTTTTDTKTVRKKPEGTGILAFKNNLADLLEDVSEDKLGAQASLNNHGSNASAPTRSILTTQARNGSGGINNSSLSRNVGGAGNQVAAVAFSRVESAIGTAIGEDRPLSNGPGPSRTDEEIQIVFDRYKAALYRIYNRELRSNPTLQGKMVLRMTIEPDGSVSMCRVESTDLESQTLSQQIVARVKQFNFGAKPDVPRITILYPIDFLPSS